MKSANLNRFCKMIVAGIALASLQVLNTGSAFAAYPERPIKLIVVSAAGGATDIIARLVADYMGKKLGRQVIVENQTGGGGIVGLRAVAASPADGYTLVVTSTGPLTASPFMYSKPPFDPVADFTPISIITRYYQLLVTNAGFEGQTLSDFLTYTKAHPNQVSAGNGGVGSTSYLGEMLLNKLAGIQLKILPYSGTGPAIVDMMGGHINMVLSDRSSFAASLPSGKLRPIATTGNSRPRLFPDLPYVAELVPGWNSVGWYGLLAAKGTPKDIIDLLSKTVKEALADPKLKSYLYDQDSEIVGSTPEQFTTQINLDLIFYKKLVSDLGIRLD